MVILCSEKKKLVARKGRPPHPAPLDPPLLWNIGSSTKYCLLSNGLGNVGISVLKNILNCVDFIKIKNKVGFAVYIIRSIKKRDTKMGKDINKIIKRKKGKWINEIIIIHEPYTGTHAVTTSGCPVDFATAVARFRHL